MIQLMYHERRKLEKTFKSRTFLRIIKRCLGTVRHPKSSIRYFTEKRAIRKSGLFDEEYYLQNNSDLLLTHIDLLRHFILHGWLEGRNPSNDFDLEFYLNHYPNVRISGVNPLFHYLTKGSREGRAKNQIEYAAKKIRESGLFDDEYYLETNPDVRETSIDPLRHFITYGWKEGRNPNINLDTITYLDRYPEVIKTNTDPLSHYLTISILDNLENQQSLDTIGTYPKILMPGVETKTGPIKLIKYRLILGRLFDRKFYRENNEELYDLTKGALRHFLKHGWQEHRDPSAGFSFNYYLTMYPDVADAGVDPLIHYIKHGRKEGRLPSASPLEPSIVRKLHNRVLELSNKFKRNKYECWLRSNTPSRKDLDFQRNYKFPYNPLISIVVPVYNPPVRVFKEMIESVKVQTYSHWELCLSDSSTNRKLQKKVEKTACSDKRIKYIKHHSQKGISESSNSALSISTGEFVGLLDQDDLIAPDALFEVINRLNVNREIDIIYTDEDKISENSRRFSQPHFKPDWSPDTFMSIMYTCHFTVYRKKLIEYVGGFRSEYDGAQDYDLMLRIAEKTKNIVHIPRVLYHWRVSKTSVAERIDNKNYAIEAACNAKTSALKRRRLKGELREIKDIPGQFCVEYSTNGSSLVSIIIPTKDKAYLLEQCIDSIISKTSYLNYEIIIVDNRSVESHTHRYFGKVKKLENVRVIPYLNEFNFSSINNYAVLKSSGKYLLFLNNDTEITQNNWLSKLLGFAQLDHVGAVGAQLLYPDKMSIQHCGIINLFDGPVHAFINSPKKNVQYFGRNRVDYNWIAVTAACMMISRKKFDKIKGFDEDFKIAYNDVDLCFRLIKQGYYNICANSVQVVHHESASRELDNLNHFKKIRLGKERELLYRKNPEFIHFDPFFNRNFNQHRVDFALKD